MFDYNYLFNYFDDDQLAAEWFNHICSRVAWKAFEDQESMVYMADELGPGKLPRFKEGAIEKLQDTIIHELSWMIGCMTTGFIQHFRVSSNIELSEEMEDWLIDEMGADAYGEWEMDARKTIFEEYRDFLGTEKAEQLAKEWWGENNGVC